VRPKRSSCGEIVSTAATCSRPNVKFIIGHGEETYRLRLTSQNKLILTK